MTDKPHIPKGKNLFVVGGKVNPFPTLAINFIVDEKYEFIKLVGGGAYGVVISAKNKLTEEEVAIKKITNAFSDLIDAKRILREIKLLSRCILRI
jgi:mitogen-activated protein kinase 1/3